ncbi:MAG: hypothetical protein H7831_10515 [Magnetococcus sp. WYHC-3]
MPGLWIALLLLLLIALVLRLLWKTGYPKDPQGTITLQSQEEQHRLAPSWTTWTLLILATVLFGALAVLRILETPAVPPSGYVPPHAENGHILPGYFSGKPAASPPPRVAHQDR